MGSSSIIPIRLPLLRLVRVGSFFSSFLISLWPMLLLPQLARTASAAPAPAPAPAGDDGYQYHYNYGDALDKSLMFFEAQRSGKLSVDQRIKWRSDSGLRDGFLQGVDLLGGYYDAGDHVKFGLPMAYSTTMLAWGAVEFRKEITHLNQMGHTLRAIKWATDYFIKSHPQPDILWAQVGDGSSDHYCWERAEDMSTPRDAYKLDHEHPGSDLAGETAAALAAASLAFKPYNSSYSALLLVHAKQLFAFADRFRGQYDDSIQNAQQFYPSSGYSDELLWAAVWLYRATGDEYYLKYVVDNGAAMGGTTWGVKEFSWDTKYAGVQILLSKVLMDNSYSPYTSILKQYQAKAQYFACACLQKNGGYNVDRTPGGLLYFHEWNNLQYVSAAAFLLTAYSAYLSAANANIACPDAQLQPQDLLNFAKSQADYVLGKNPKSMSYLVGYGTNYPTHIHHRGASIPSISLLRSAVGCVRGFDAWYSRPQGNPNVIYGALVGGPNKNDGFDDNRSSYEQTEPTLSGCAPLIGLFSKLQSVYGTPAVLTGSYHNQRPAPAGHSKSAEQEAPVEFFHSITNTWADGRGMAYYRHRVIIKNTSQKASIRDLKLLIQNLSGSLWGLSSTRDGERNTYELPQGQKVLKPGGEYSFVYIQGGPQAKITVVSYH
ncbi:endoglucanase 5 isoform X2 [Punica granatum]|uniref:Endoglucanase n=1 Tax=Punica granatum TaxID=22663 RepID=A0A6P8BPN7_PUNGR|nr:endoglucanase 5 isoform X2 [Punica granatum]